MPSLIELLRFVLVLMAGGAVAGILAGMFGIGGGVLNNTTGACHVEAPARSGFRHFPDLHLDTVLPDHYPLKRSAIFFHQGWFRGYSRLYLGQITQIISAKMLAA